MGTLGWYWRPERRRATHLQTRWILLPLNCGGRDAAEPFCDYGPIKESQRTLGSSTTQSIGLEQGHRQLLPDCWACGSFPGCTWQLVGCCIINTWRSDIVQGVNLSHGKRNSSLSSLLAFWRLASC
ncbi:hypothetical protein GQ607_012719 [Colletotrichum asianum]|uniref:Uncharacterized protein n=1 Tax=Colletotrichum asianum TaxID=702518 RepID=A0A8H3ZQK6_9PEZI|nr:hypothetical protein GQ607_012719 [Colletotrichum asianum]